MINSGFHKIVWEFLLSCLKVRINGGHIEENQRQIIVASRGS